MYPRPIDSLNNFLDMAALNGAKKNDLVILKMTDITKEDGITTSVYLKLTWDDLNDISSRYT